MIRNAILMVLIAGLLVYSCQKDDEAVIVPEFNFTETVTFDENLSSYSIFDGSMSDLIPTQNYFKFELNSTLFTDYAYKQRLISVPVGTEVTHQSDGTLSFPDGTIIAKTFYYFVDERDETIGRNIIETRLLMKQSGYWNAATYVWNESQTDATLSPNRETINISWIDGNGINKSTSYSVPSSNDCVACHQSNLQLKPIGPKLMNLNRLVERGGNVVNQLEFFQSEGILSTFSVGSINSLADYKDASNSLSDRGRAYLEVNCAHCHNPSGWEVPAQEGFDFRYETELSSTGIQDDVNEIINAVEEGEMPFLGTTLLDEEGIEMLVNYLNSL